MPHTTRAFLNVERSATGRAWLDRLDDAGRMRALAIAQQHEIGDLLSRILAGRGVGVDDVARFLSPSIRDEMPDPDTLTGMTAAVERLVAAVRRGETIAIFGDYDVDGATSSALMATFLRHCGLDPAIHIPDRITEGYGPNAEAIAALKARGATLLLTLDCGTTSHDVLGDAARAGLDVVVIDHHQADETLPEVLALVNPNRLDDISGLGYLCAAGVVFMVIVALNRALRAGGFWTASRPEPDLMALCDLVALGTVADVVPLKGLNRAFVTRGLAVMKRRERPGLRALMDVARLNGPPTPYHLGFMLGPRINAGGRIGDAALGARLLTMSDEDEAVRIAQDLDRLNKERQVVEEASLTEAMNEALAALGPQEDAANVLVCAGRNWHPGIVGLIASRLKERFRRPAFAVAFTEDRGTGSGRSVGGVDLGRAVRKAVAAGLLVKGGGHAMAAGITIEKAKLGAFRAFLEEVLAVDMAQARAEDVLSIDAATTAGAIKPQLVHDLNRAGPFGMGNPEPFLALPSHQVVFAETVGESHLRLRLKAGDGSSVDAMAFRAVDQPLGQAILAARGKPIHAAGTLMLNHWQGREQVKLRLVDIAPVR